MPRPYFKISKEVTDSIIRVDHAGEFGAQRIYEGQIKYTKDPAEKKLIKHMLEQELEHLGYFENKIKEQGTRPTFLLPLWHFGGYAIGAVSSKISPKTAMLVTERVEEVIEQHYTDQIDLLEKTDPHNKMLPSLRKFREEEAEHKHIAIDHDSRSAPLEPIFARAVHVMCKFAIYLSKRV